MEQINQIHRLYNQGVGIREISRRTGISRNSVKKYIKCLPTENASDDDSATGSFVYPSSEELEYQKKRLEVLQNYIEVNFSELKKTGVTRGVLWQEYLALYPDGYSYSQFCYHLSLWAKKTDVVMHLEYKPAELIMIDFAGKKLHYTDADTGEVFPCEVFIAILPYSGLIFCMAVSSQKTIDFVWCINSMLLYFGGVSKTMLGDNMKTLVKRVDRYEPEFTEVCSQLSEHYKTTFSAARPYTPRDKAMVEKAVDIVYTHIYAPIRNQVFHSLEDLNRTISAQLEQLNNRDYKKSGHSRRWFFEQEEKHLLAPLPSTAFELKKTVTATVQRNYHVQLRETGRYYSVPYLYAGKKVKVLYDAKTIEIYYQTTRIAFHIHTLQKSVYNTIIDHMPPNHQKAREINGWSREDLLTQAARLGEPVVKAAELILSSNNYEVQNYKSCHAMMMLAKKYSTQRLQAACRRALLGTRVTYTMIKNILQTGLDKQQTLFSDTGSSIPVHDNIRGKDNYQ